jgi:hypothetical protein
MAFNTYKWMKSESLNSKITFLNHCLLVLLLSQTNLHFQFDFYHFK